MPKFTIFVGITFGDKIKAWESNSIEDDSLVEVLTKFPSLVASIMEEHLLLLMNHLQYQMEIYTLRDELEENNE